MLTQSNNVLQEWMRITAGGQIGMGTQTPGAALHLSQQDASFLIDGAGTHSIAIQGPGSNGRFGQDGEGMFFASDTNGRAFKFLTNNGALNEHMRISSAGNVGIGTTTPAAKLDVNGTAKMINIQITGGTPGVGKVLTSDASGNGTWQTPAGGGGAATDVNCPAGCVESADITDGTITSADIASDTITAANIATGAVATAEILDGTIANADIAAGAAIDPAKIAGTAAVLGTNAFTGGQSMVTATGIAAGNSTAAVYAHHTGAVGGHGVYGHADGLSSTGVTGQGGDMGGNFFTASAGGYGVRGLATNTGGAAYGGKFTTYSSGGVGLWAENLSATGNGFGGYFLNANDNGTALRAISTRSGGTASAGHFEIGSAAGKAIIAEATSSSGASYGIFSKAWSPTGFGGWFQNMDQSLEGKALVAADRQGNEILTVKGNGKVGVGTPAPSVKLEVWGADPFSGTFLNGSGPTSGTVDIMSTETVLAADRGPILAFGGYRGSLATDPGVFAGIRGAKENATDGNRNGYLALYTTQSGVAFAERLRVTSIGNVGIGTSAPGAKLEISGQDTITRIRNTNDTGGGYVGQTWSTLQLGLYNPSGGAWGVVPAGVTRSFFGIETSGKVGSLTSVFGQPTFRNLLDDGSGNVGIGTLAPTERVHVIGNILASGSITQNSSRRFKSNIAPLTGALDSVQRMRGVSFDWNESGRHDIGVIAEEMREVQPEVVLMEANGVDAKGVDYARLTAVLIEAVKQLRAEKDAQISAQRSEISELREMLMSLQRQLGTQVSKAVSGH